MDADVPENNTTPASAPILKLINDQLLEERSSKSSLEARAVGVITTSGTLATLLFALAALITKSQTYTPPTVVKVFLLGAIGGFLSAAIIALWAARPVAYQEFQVDSLRDLVTSEAMNATELDANLAIFHGMVKIIETARKRNGEKATALKRAVYSEVAGALLLGIAVAVALIQG